MIKSVTLTVTEKMVDDFMAAYEVQSKSLQFMENPRIRVKQGIHSILGSIGDQFIDQIVTAKGDVFRKVENDK